MRDSIFWQIVYSNCIATITTTKYLHFISVLQILIDSISISISLIQISTLRILKKKKNWNNEGSEREKIKWIWIAMQNNKKYYLNLFVCVEILKENEKDMLAISTNPFDYWLRACICIWICLFIPKITQIQNQ